MLLIGKKFLSILKHNQRTPITRSAKIMGQKPTKLKRSDSCICGQFANHDCSCVFVCHCATESSLVPSLLVSQAPMTPHFSPLEIFTSTQVGHLGRRQCSCQPQQAQLYWKTIKVCKHFNFPYKIITQNYIYSDYYEFCELYQGIHLEQGGGEGLYQGILERGQGVAHKFSKKTS